MKTWGNNSWRTGGGGGWMPGTYDSETNTIWWGTANPAPLYDWSGADWKTQGARPGDNLYTTSVIALDLGYRQAEILSSGAAARRLGFRQRGRRVPDARPRRPEARRASQQERLRLRLRPQSTRKLEERLAARQNINFVKDIDPKTGELIGRRDFTAGKVERRRCARPLAAASAGTAARTTRRPGLYYKIGQEWCMTLEVGKTTPVVAPQVQLNIGADFKMAPPPGGEIYGHLDARDPVTGAKKWEVRYPEPPTRERAVDRRQSGVRARLPRRGCTPMTPKPAASCGLMPTAPAIRAGSSATRRRQTIYRRRRRLRRHGVGRIRGAFGERLQEHAAR